MIDQTIETRARRRWIIMAILIGLSCAIDSPAWETRPPAEKAENIRIDRQRGELHLRGVIQRNPKRPTHSRWSKKSTGFVGVKGGDVEKDFMVVLFGARAEIYRAARDDLGWETGRRHTWKEAKRLRGLTEKTRLEDYMTGDPMLCILEFESGGKTVRVALQDVIRCRIKVGREWIEVPYTPHFVFTGAGEENKIDSGCVFCPSDCVGAIFTDNSMPVQTETQEFLINWDRLPTAGSGVTVILRSIR